jgi:polysaccharide chain length determinant protein (PEP-CTERM system associated)
MLPGKKYAIQDYVAVAKRYWWIVVSTTAIATFVALIVSSRQKDSYQSEMLVQIVPQSIPNSMVQSTVTSKTEDRMSSLEAQVRSRAQLERLITDLDLYAEERTRLPMEDVVEKMRGAIVVQLVRPGRMAAADAFYLRFTYHMPDVAARVTTALGGLFIEQNAQERGRLADGTNTFLEAQVVEAKARLAEHEQKVERFRQQHAGRLPTQADFNLQAIQTTQSQLQALVESMARDRDRRLMLERLYRDASQEPLPASPPLQTGQTPAEGGAAVTLPLKQQLQIARTVLERLEMRMTGEHPDLRRQRSLVKELEQKVADEAAANAQGIPVTAAAVSPEQLQRREQLRTMAAELESLKRQIDFKEIEERKLRATVNDYQQRLEAIPGVESEWIALNRDYETLQTAYKDLLRKSEESKVGADLERMRGGEQFKIVDTARVPVKPTGPVRLQINAIGVAAGLVLGIAIVAVLFLRDSALRTEADVLGVLALPVLALIPLVIDQGERQRLRRRQALMMSTVALLLVTGGIVTWSMKLWRYVA